MDINKAIGCMVASAYGDTLGAAVEFLGLSQIREKYGQSGITLPQPAFGFPHPVVTDDTQMAMATAEGLLGAPVKARRNIADLMQYIWFAYQDWRNSQVDPANCRGPGSTCLSSLADGVLGTVTERINQSAGCGGIMRVHPIGIAFAHDPRRAFEMGMASAALTHGHPNAFVPAGAQAAFIAFLVSGRRLQAALEGVLEFIRDLPFEETVGTIQALRKAFSAPRTGDHGKIIDKRVGQSPRSGGGWLGHDALAIAFYAVHSAMDDPSEALRIAVNHSGDSDSTGAIAGAMLGAMHGPESIFEMLRKNELTLEHHQRLVQLAHQLAEMSRVMEDSS